MNIIQITRENIINKNTLKLFENEIKFKNIEFNDEIYLGIRPEDISLKNSYDIKLTVKVDLIENLGFEKIIYTSYLNNEIKIKSSDDTKEQSLDISFPKEKVFFFDKDKNRIR